MARIAPVLEDYQDRYKTIKLERIAWSASMEVILT